MSDERHIEWQGPKQVIPKQIILETSRTCNLRCVGCPINTDSVAGFMDMGYFQSVIDRIDFPTVVIPWMNGEPLLHPEYPQMVEYVTDRNLRMYITTNGHFWNDRLFDHITNPTSCYQIIFSVDGVPGSPSVSAARPGSRPEKVFDTIMSFLQLKKSKGAAIDVAVKLVERGQDYGEIEEYIVYWLDAGVDYVCTGRMLDTETVEPMRRYPCQYYDNNFMVIRHDGELVLCAYNDHVVNEHANPLFYLDRKRPLLEAYNDPRYQYYRERQRKGIYDGPCSNCGFAYTGFGIQGSVEFRDPDLARIGIVWYHKDHYNTFYSRVRNWKPKAYYAGRQTV